jgi:ABC-2 type transport system permease protein
MWAICKKEWTHYFGSLVGYLIISFYLIVNGLFLFVLPSYNIFDFGYASLQVYFDFAPWFLLLLVPAITMRSFADEQKQGTYELLKTLPISAYQLLVGKFFGAFLIVAIAIAPTLLYAIALDQLSATGGLDWGATIGAYIGLFLLAAVYTAIGIFTSSITKHALVALLLSIVLSIFLYKGFDWISAWQVFANGNDYYIKQLGLSFHYENISKGVLTIKEGVYFISVIILFGLGCIENIKGKSASIIGLIVILVLNFASSWFSLQLDLTKDQRYTLSSSTKHIIQQVQQPIKLHLYLGGNLPARYKKMELATKAILEKIVQNNPVQISWVQEVPNQIYKDSALYQFYDSLTLQGLPIERVQSADSKQDQRIDQLLIPGILVELQGQNPIAIDLRSSKKYYKPYNIVKDIPEEDLDATANAAEALLEFKITQAIYLLSRTTIPTIGYLVGNGEPVDLSVNDIGQSIRHQYHVAVYDLKKGFPTAERIKTLLIVKPTIPFTDLDKLKIDQYMMSGGNIIWAVDKLHAEYDSLQKTAGSYIAYDRGLNLDDLFFKYGVRVNNNLVQDLNCAKLPVVVGKGTDGSPMIQRVPWPYYPFLYGNNEHVMVKNMDRVLAQFPSSIDTIRVPGIQKTILLTTDTNSRVLSSPNLISLNSGKEAGAIRSFNQHQIAVSVLLEGKFHSLFKNKITASLNDSIVKYTGKSFLGEGVKVGKQIIVSDADVFTNSVDKTKGPLPMGMIPFEDYQFANNVFFTNCISYLNEPIDLLESRNKTLILRQLNKNKIEEYRLFWQLVLILGPLLCLIIGYFAWNSARKRQFAA